MSEHGVSQLDMRILGRSGDELDLLLVGAGGPRDPFLTRFVEDLRDAHPEDALDRAVEDRHLTLIVAALAPPRAEPALQAGTTTEPLPHRLSGLARKVAACLTAGFTAFGGAAYAGVLPDPLQRIAQDIAQSVGLTVPGPDEEQTSPSAPAEESGRNRRLRGLEHDSAGSASGESSRRSAGEGSSGSGDEERAGDSGSVIGAGSGDDQDTASGDDSDSGSRSDGSDSSQEEDSDAGEADRDDDDERDASGDDEGAEEASDLPEADVDEDDSDPADPGSGGDDTSGAEEIEEQGLEDQPDLDPED